MLSVFLLFEFLLISHFWFGGLELSSDYLNSWSSHTVFFFRFFFFKVDIYLRLTLKTITMQVFVFIMIGYGFLLILCFF